MGYDKGQRDGKRQHRQDRDRKRNGGDSTIGGHFKDVLERVETVKSAPTHDKKPHYPKKDYQGGNHHHKGHSDTPPRPRMLRARDAKSGLSDWWKEVSKDEYTTVHQMVFMRIIRAEVKQGPFCKWTVEFNRGWKDNGNDWAEVGSGVVDTGLPEDVTIAKASAQLLLTHLQDSLDVAALEDYKANRIAQKAERAAQKSSPSEPKPEGARKAVQNTKEEVVLRLD